MATVGIIFHPQRPHAVELADTLMAELKAGGHDARLPTDAASASGLDLAVSLGGDGTMLRTVDLVAATGVPILGVNVGHLGYLTEVDGEDAVGAVERFLAGDYRIESRMTLAVGVSGAEHHAFNEAVVEKTVSGHTIRVAVSIDGRPFTTYAADGLIVATPTGSTAYSLSAHGPIVSPTHRGMILTPVSPHMLFARSLVLGPDETVQLAVISGPPAVLVVDGSQRAELGVGDVVSCRAGDHDVNLVTFGQRDFHGILKRKFGLADR